MDRKSLGSKLDHTTNRKSLESKLEYTRNKMIRSGIENGLQNPKTIRLSKQLDRILNELSQLQQ